MNTCVKCFQPSTVPVKAKQTFNNVNMNHEASQLVPTVMVRAALNSFSGLSYFLEEQNPGQSMIKTEIYYT